MSTDSDAASTPGGTAASTDAGSTAPEAKAAADPSVQPVAATRAESGAVAGPEPGPVASAESGAYALTLRDRAYALVAARGAVPEAEVLTHVYGGRPPATLHASLAAPLLADPRLERREDGQWVVRGASARRKQQSPTAESALTVLALATTGPTPGRGRIVSIAMLRLEHREIAERFSATLNPGTRVPRYVAQRLGLEPEMLDGMSGFESIVDELITFLADRPILAQDARLNWAFLDAEARMCERVLAPRALIDANELALRVLQLPGKPSLGLVAEHLAIGTTHLGRPEEEARVLGLVGSRLIAIAHEQGIPSIAAAEEVPETAVRPLRRAQTARALPDEPGVYVMRDADAQPLYVGKARRLRSRMAAYVHRPLGATRRLEGLVGTAEAVDTTRCATDLEALVLESREIRRLQPRFNTARRQSAPRLWIRLPPARAVRRSGRRAAPARLELSLGPSVEDGDFIGPFRNETAANQARLLAREVFDLDSLRRTQPETYAERLQLAWEFLHGDSTAAEPFARARSARLLRAVLNFAPGDVLLPADPRDARYAVVRPGPNSIEGFVIARGILQASAVLQDGRAAFEFAQELLADSEPRTGPEDVDVVLRWFGAQRPPARLVLLPDEPLAAADAIESAVSAVLSDRAAESPEPADF